MNEKSIKIDWHGFESSPLEPFCSPEIQSSPEHQTRYALQKRITGHKRDKKTIYMLSTNYRPAKLADRGGDLSKEWYVYYSYIHPDTKKLERFRIKGEMNREKTKIARLKIAKVLISAINKLLRAGWNPFTQDYTPANMLTIGGIFERSIKYKQGTVKASTLGAYQMVARKLTNYLDQHRLAQMPCTYLTANHILQHRDDEIKAGLTAKTVNTNISHLRALWNAAVERGDVTFNPFKNIKDLREVQSERNVPLDTDELQRVSEHLQLHHPGLLLLCRFIYGAAVRPLECLGIRRRHVDFDQGIIKLPGTISKNSKSDVVDLPGQILQQLSAMHFDKADPDTLLFSGHDLQPGDTTIHRNRVSELWKRLVRQELGIDKDMYSLKHRGAIDLVNAGVDIKKIQSYMRHSSLDITDKYLRTLTGQRLEAVRSRDMPL